MLTEANTTCPDCGGDYNGDGYSAPLVCENYRPSKTEVLEPDSGPHNCGQKLLGYCPVGTVLLEEDDCAPDGFEYFDREMDTLYGLTPGDFLREHAGENYPIYLWEGMTVQYHLRGYVLEYSADDPRYILKSGVV